MATSPTVEATLPTPGIRKGLTFEQYHAIPAVSHSLLEPYKRTPAHAREAMLHPADSTPELALGQAFHLFVLEPERFGEQYVVPPKVDRRFKAGKETWAMWEAANPGKQLLSEKEFDQYNYMRESILAHQMASDLLLRAAAREVSFVWHEEVELPDGSIHLVACKGREDILTPNGGFMWIVNLKTTRDASDRSFSRDMGKYGYHRGSAWYRRGLASVVPTPPENPRRVAYIAVEKDPPYCVAVHELEDRAVEQGEREMMKFLQKHVECEITGRFPGYDQGMGLLDLPPWDVDTLDKE